VVPNTPDKGDYGSVESYPYALRLAVPGELNHVRGLVHEAAEWLRTSKDTDQWATPWPDRAGQRERILNDLFKGKTWIVWDGPSVAATITVDTEEPLTLNGQPVWPPCRFAGRSGRNPLSANIISEDPDFRPRRAAGSVPRSWTGRPTWRNGTTAPR